MTSPCKMKSAEVVVKAADILASQQANHAAVKKAFAAREYKLGEKK